jgi:hypothetical protein
MKLKVPQRIFENVSNTKFHQIVQWESTYSMRTDREMDMTKVIVAFRNFAKVPNTNGNTSLR